MRTNSSGKAGPPMPFDCAANSINFNTQIGNMRDPRRARNAYVTLYYAGSRLRSHWIQSNDLYSKEYY